MYEFEKPDYRGNSIINLMSSISGNFGKKHDYPELGCLKSGDLGKFRNIVLIVIDGLGYNYLKTKKRSFLLDNLKSKMTSTFLSSTVCANTSFSVGYPPQQHALTGWDINLKEVGAITAILPFVPKYGFESLSKANFDMNGIMDIKSFHEGFKGKCFTLIDKKISNSPFTNYVSKDTEIIPTGNYKNTFTKLKKLIKKRSRKRRLIHAYILELDSMTHREGVKSRKVNEIFWDLDNRIKSLSESVKGTNSLILVVSDHGLTDTSPKNEIWIENIAGLKECLTIPLAGEPRARDVFIRPGKVKEFERIVKTKLSKFCWCFRGEQLIKDNFYGLGKPNKKLLERVGDYVLIMKENYILRDKLANYEKPEKFDKGQHGGVSDDEMFVPLISIEC
ncbi:MAG: alkaline phosphatase family protein [Candidatus Aenigmarchaeota archaeon]|nr:alkaline phosphatase family protein [Candidatus Aenigmarchaeota archaeon]